MISQRNLLSSCGRGVGGVSASQTILAIGIVFGCFPGLEGKTLMFMKLLTSDKELAETDLELTWKPSM